MINDQSWLASKFAGARRAFASWGIPPFLKLGALIVAGITPFAIFVALQATSNTGNGDSDLEPLEQLPLDQRIPLAFPFGVPETSPPLDTLPTTTTLAVPAAVTVRGQCANGRDDDGDKRVDLADSGCTSRSDNSERNVAPVPTTRRAPTPTTVPVTAAPPTSPPTTAASQATTAPSQATTAPSRVTTTSRPPTPSTLKGAQGECSDGIDNDGDGLIDAADKTSCALGPDNDE